VSQPPIQPFNSQQSSKRVSKGSCSAPAPVLPLFCFIRCCNSNKLPGQRALSEGKRPRPSSGSWGRWGRAGLRDVVASSPFPVTRFPAVPRRSGCCVHTGVVFTRVLRSHRCCVHTAATPRAAPSPRGRALPCQAQGCPQGRVALVEGPGQVAAPRGMP